MHYPGDVDEGQAPGGPDRREPSWPQGGDGGPGYPVAGDDSMIVWQDEGYGSLDSGDSRGGYALAGSAYGTAGGFGRKGPARGYPPAAGQAPPVYPPGQFAAWNLPAQPSGADSVAAAWPGAASAEHGYGWPAAQGPGRRGAGVPMLGDPARPWTEDTGWSLEPVTGPDAAVAWPASQAAGGPGPAGTGEPATRAEPSGPAGPDEPAGPARNAPRSQRSRRRGGRLRLLVALGVVVVAAAAVVYVLRPGRHPAHPVAGPAPSTSATPSATPSASTSSPASPSPSATPSPSSTGRWGHIQTRSVDPVPLTLGELFPHHFSVSGTSYAATVSKIGKHCTPALLGARLQAAVQEAECTQVLRASYLSGDSKIMGTIGVLNLRSARVAQHAGMATGPHEFIVQLRGRHGPTRNLSKGTGIEAADVKGHYLILVWAEFANLNKPKTANQKAALVKFEDRVIAHTANVSLSKRLVTGKP